MDSRLAQSLSVTMDEALSDVIARGKDGIKTTLIMQSDAKSLALRGFIAKARNEARGIDVFVATEAGIAWKKSGKKPIALIGDARIARPTPRYRPRKASS